MNEPNPYDGSSPVPAQSTAPRDVAIAAVASILVAFAGGYGCGLVIDQFNEIGSVSLWLLGWAAGAAVSKVITPRKTAGYLLAASVMVAFVLAEITWIHFNIEGAEDWFEAAKMFPLFLQQYQISALLGGLMAFFGATSVYRQTGQRVRYVAVVDA